MSWDNLLHPNWYIVQKSKVVTMIYKTLDGLPSYSAPPFHLWLHLLAFALSFILSQVHWPPWFFGNIPRILLPQILCIWRLLCLNHFSPRHSITCSLTPFKSWFKLTFSRKPSLITVFKIKTLHLTWQFHLLLPFCFLHNLITIYHTIYFISQFLYL